MSNIFENESKGEIPEIRDQLDGNDPALRKNAAKRCISLMRSGENVQCLFSSMLRCVKTNDIELKKLSYLYLVQYSSQEPEQAIMTVNTFILDSQDDNPLVRALAVRTMCRIKLESVAEHMIVPLKKCLADKDPYVRKTAAFGVAKLYEIIPEAVENANLFADLLNLLKDENPMVVSNTTSAIFEINDKRTSPIFLLNADTIGPLLSALSSCTEWCQTILLDTLAHYKPETSEDATFLIERLTPFLKHSNPSVVIGAFKCIFLLMEYDKRNPSEIFPTIIPPFITLVNSTESEIQYVVLRTISLFVMKYPKVLAKEIRVFFCKYNDPSYVKMEKLGIIVTICGPQSAQLVLDELSEYTNSVDVAFVQKSVRAIGQIAVKIELSARRCVDILVNLIQGKADYALEEAIIVMTDILRRYPGIFESVISNICHSFEQIRAPRAKAAGIWILGEYSSLIEKVDILLDPFLDTFHDEEPLVQLQLLASMVKIYVEKPDATKDQLQFLLNEATKDGNVPDVKNRAMVYWRLLSSEISVAKNVLTFSKETVVHSGVSYEESVLLELMKNMGSVSGVLHVVPSDFVRRVRFVPEIGDSIQEDQSLRMWHKALLNDSTNLELFFDYDYNFIYLRILNKSLEHIGGFQFAVNKNPIGLMTQNSVAFPQFVESGDFAEIAIPYTLSKSNIMINDQGEIQYALKSSIGTVFAKDRAPFELTLKINGNIGQDRFREIFALQNETKFILENAEIMSSADLEEKRVYTLGVNGNKHYVSFIAGDDQVAVELSQDQKNISVIAKSLNQKALAFLEQAARILFTK